MKRITSAGPGLAGMLAALMSTADTMMVAAAGATVTRDLYRPFVVPSRSEWHYLVVGRVASAAGLRFPLMKHIHQCGPVDQSRRMNPTLRSHAGSTPWHQRL